MARLMRSLQDSLIAVSGAILTTFVPLPRKNARGVPAQATKIFEYISMVYIVLVYNKYGIIYNVYNIISFTA